MKKRIHGFVFFRMLFCCLFFCTACAEKGQIITNEDNVGTESEEAVVSADAADFREKAVDTLFVYVCGAVSSPGVYELKSAARIYEAIEAAGGMTAEAAAESLNLAQPLEDGQQIYVMTAQEVQAQQEQQSDSAQSEADNGLININVASAQQLMTLPGIGESKAAAIISYREKNGRFSSIEEIMNIEGIKEGVYTKLKDKICV